MVVDHPLKGIAVPATKIPESISSCNVLRARAEGGDGAQRERASERERQRGREGGRERGKEGGRGLGEWAREREKEREKERETE